MIAGVKVKKLKIIPDDRGRLMEIDRRVMTRWSGVMTG